MHWLDKAQSVVSGAASSEKSVVASDRDERSKSNAARRERGGDFPVPAEYGAYAVVDGRLIELEQLAIRVPDPELQYRQRLQCQATRICPQVRMNLWCFEKIF